MNLVEIVIKIINNLEKEYSKMDDDTLLFSYTKGENREFSVDVIVQNHDIINFINEVYPEDCPIQVCEEFLEEAEYMTLMRLTKSDAV